VLEVGDEVFEVLSTSGDTHLSGDDFDKVVLVLTVVLFNNYKCIDQHMFTNCFLVSSV
jgi:molecular chaperone DnaK